jgi:DNA invertase Pin-like site-specific DNA recombinase
VRTGPLRAKRYGRVSTLLQGEGTSLEDQQTRTADYVARQGWADLGFVCDMQSGTTDQRDHWQQIKAEARRGDLDVVVVSRWDRFARTLLTGLQEVSELDDHGVKVAVLSPELLDTTSPGGELVMHIMLSYSHYERRIILERLSQGAHGRARNGYWPSSSRAAPMGYQKVGIRKESHLELHPKEAATIREMARLLVTERVELPEVCRILNAREMYPRGRALRGGGNAASFWYSALARKVLQEPARKGVVTWGNPANRATGKYGPVEYVKDLEPVISPELWDQVQRVLALRQGGPRNPQRVYPLSDGRLVSPCGQRYHGVIRSDTGTPRYLCVGLRWTADPDRQICGCTRLDAPAIEDRVWAEVTALLTDPARLHDLAERYLGVSTTAGDSVFNELAAIDRQVAQLRSRMAQGTAAHIRAGADPEVLAQAMALLADDLAALVQRRDDVALFAERGEQARQQLGSLDDLASSAAGRLDLMSPEERKEVLVLLGVKVYVLDQSKHPALRICGTVADLALAGNTEAEQRSPSA